MMFAGNILRLTVAELVAYGVPEGTICQGLHRHRATGSSSWNYVDDPTDKRRALINYDGIPGTTIRKYAIPTKAELLEQLKSEKTQLKAAELVWGR